MRHILLGLILCPLIAVSCGDDSTTELEGVWTQSCLVENDSDDVSVSSFTVEITENNFVFTLKSFDDNDTSCTGPVDVTVTQSGTFVIGDSLPQNSEIKEFDLTTNELNTTIHDSDLVVGANAIMLYGFNDWMINVQKSLFGANIDGTVLNQGDTTYTVFSIEDDKLRTGAGDPALDETKRPTTLDPTEILTRME